MMRKNISIGLVAAFLSGPVFGQTMDFDGQGPAAAAASQETAWRQFLRGPLGRPPAVEGGHAAPEGYGDSERLRTLRDLSSPRQAKQKALDAFISFDPATASALLHFMAREPEAELRSLAAFRLHGMFSYMEPSSLYREEALFFAVHAVTLVSVRKILVSDPASQVRHRMIHFISTIMFPFGPQALEGLARLYIPMLLEALPDPDPGNRAEALWALTQFEGAMALKAEGVREALDERIRQESDADIKDRAREIRDGFFGKGRDEQ